MPQRIHLIESSVLLYLVIGFVQGGVGWAGVFWWPKSHPLAASVVLCAMTAIAVMGLTAQLTAGKHFNRQVLVLILLLGGVVGLASAWVMWQMPGSSQPSNRGGTVLMTSWTVSSFVLAYILIPFIQAWPTRKQGRYRYSDLYRHSWDNFFILLVAAMLTLGFWLLIVLWVMLFKMVGIELFETLFFNAVFPWLSLAMVFSLGVRLARTHESVIGALRKIALSLCSFLMPLTAVITILLGGSLPFTGLSPIWDTGYSTPILLCLISANLLFVNGIVQDGTVRSLPGGLVRLYELSMVLLPVYAVIGIYSVSLRIDQYGLTPNRIFLLALVFVATCYSVVYASAVLWRSAVWMGIIRQGNMVIALMIGALILLLHSPVLNPMALSAGDQYQRLVTQRILPQEFDFGALKFHLGSPGLAYLQQLKQLPAEHPLTPTLRTWLLAVDEATSYSQWKRHKQSEGIADHPLVEFVTDSHTVPQEFLQMLDEDQCRKATCYLFPVDLDRDGVEELVLLNMQERWSVLELYDVDDTGQWVQQGRLGNSMRKEQRRALVDQLRQQQHRVVSPHYQDLEIGGEVFMFER